MQIHYLEIVTPEVEKTCTNYSRVHHVEFGGPHQGLGNARIGALSNGGLIGVRAPLSETELPIVRPYLLVENLEDSVAAVVSSGGEIIHPPLEIEAYGKFAIYTVGGNHHGIWQVTV